MKQSEKTDLLHRLKDAHSLARAKKIAIYITTVNAAMIAAKCIAQETFGSSATPDLVFAIYDRIAKDIQDISDDY